MAPITDFSANSQVYICDIGGNRDLRKRIESMGIAIGKTVELLKNTGNAVILKTENARIAIRVGPGIQIYAKHL